MACATEGIYLLQTRELITMNKNIYKIGRSFNLNKRMKQYPKESNLILLVECCNSVKCEAELLKIFRKQFIESKKYGNEYFEGDKEKMKKLIFNYIEKETEDVIREKEKEMKDKKEKEKENKKKTEIKEIKIKNDIVINKTCPNCKTEFNYPSLLKIHLKDSARCKLNKPDLDIFINNMNDIKCKDIICDYCKNKFTKQSSLVFHNKNSKCGKAQLSIKSIIQPILSVAKTDTLAINNIENNNNNTNIINSFTNESFPKLSINEFTTFFNTDNPEISILKLVYSNIDNNNFFKYNISKKGISYLNSGNLINTIDENKFLILLLQNSIDILKSLFISFIKNKTISLQDSKFIYYKIYKIENSIIDKIYKYTEVKIFLDTYFRETSKNIKINLKNYINIINDNLELKEKNNKSIIEKKILMDERDLLLNQYILENELALT